MASGNIHDESESRNRDYAEILSRLEALQESKQERTPEIPLIDPTANVISLISLRDQRQDDLRAAEVRRKDDLHAAETKRLEDLLAAATARLDALRELDQAYQAKLLDSETQHTKRFQDREAQHNDDQREAESSRIDALLSGLKGEIGLSGERANNTALTLQRSVDTLAESLRSRQEQSNSTMMQAIKELQMGQYQSGTVRIQAGEGRQQNYTVIGIGIAAAGMFIAFATLVVHFLK
jgi:hypothetical protein